MPESFRRINGLCFWAKSIADPAIKALQLEAKASGINGEESLCEMKKTQKRAAIIRNLIHCQFAPQKGIKVTKSDGFPQCLVPLVEAF
jgi:hypothetical protein